MHKSKSNAQLSLFSSPPQNDAESKINQTNGNDHVNNNANNPSGNSIRTGSSGEDSVQSSGSIQTGSPSVNDKQRNSDTNPAQSRGGISQQNDPSDGRGAERIPGEGTDLARDNQQIQSVDFSFSGQETAKTFNKRLRLLANIEAIQTLKRLKEEKRGPNALERDTLFGYVGFGGLKEILLDPAKDADWQTPSDQPYRNLIQQFHQTLQALDQNNASLLLAAARRGIISSYYTPVEIIQSIYKAIELTGFSGGNILEPAAGTGKFLSVMPISIAGNSNITAIEVDTLPGQILANLFPLTNVLIKGFEQSNLPENSFDLIISNVPFGNIHLYDKLLENNPDKRFRNASGNIHNYYFAKSILLAKPGGLIAFLTSRYTLDSSKSQEIRELMNENTEFLGAIRLPDTAFKAQAGTEVVTDIIFLRKFQTGETPKQKHCFLEVETVPFTDSTGKKAELSYNQYFHEHPSHMIGQLEYGGLYNKDSFNLSGNQIASLSDSIDGISAEIFPKPLYNITKLADSLQTPAHSQTYADAILPSMYETIGNLVIKKDGSVGTISTNYYISAELEAKARGLGLNTDRIRNGATTYQDDEMLENAGINKNDFLHRAIQPEKIRKEDLPKVALLIQIRNLTKELFFLELHNHNEYKIEQTRKLLHQAYNKFVRRFDHLLDKKNFPILSKDSDQFTITSLEVIDRKTKKIRPSDVLYKRTINPVKNIYTASNIHDAILVSLEEFGKINMDRISVLLNKPADEILQEQKGDDTFIFKTHDGKLVTRDEYLSGNILEKIQEAEKALESDTTYQNNIAQLQKVIPKPIPAVDIYSPLHAKWIPDDIIAQFLYELTSNRDISILYQKSSGLFKVSIPFENAQTEAFKTKRKNAQWLINHAVNGIEPVVKYTVEIDDKPVQFVDEQDTQLAKELYRKIKSTWDEWKYADKPRRDRISKVYNSMFNNTVLRTYNGAHLNLPGLMNFELKPHQKDVVFRNLQTKGGIADHKVGSGKTLVAICTSMEMRRLGVANKPMIIGLKSQIPQLHAEFKRAYPLSRVLFPSEKDFTKDNRKQLLNSIATNDWDCIIISHDQFNRIRQPLAIQEAMIEEMTDVIRAEMYACTDKKEKKAYENRLYKYEQKLASLQDSAKDKDILDFSELGVDFLMIDESQEYKNLEFTTMKKNIRGLGNMEGSKKAFNLLIACRHLQKLNGSDRGILFASGTPISNSMAEMYLLFKYLQPQKMRKLGFNTFDQWAANFANDYSDLEYYMGKFKEVHRFREFANLPELITMYREIADVRNKFNLKIDEPDLSHHLVKIQPSQNQLTYIELLQDYIETKGNAHAHRLGLTAGYDENKKVNPSYAILAINFARKLSMDPRLIHPSAEAGTKIKTAAENIFRIYTDTHPQKGTQLIFSDIGTPKSANSVENIFNFLEGSISESDFKDIFGEEFHEKNTKPSLPEIKGKIAQVLNIVPPEIDMLITEANQAEHFNVYTSLKQELTLLGIPEAEIAFIHDYKTRKERDILYDKVNNGEIRALLGSTIKLGTGVNVQQRVAALHHLDISWKPSHMEQRNGRGGRQGNYFAKDFLNNTVPAYYYATERTLDASMYNVVSMKARFIAQTKLGEVHTRSVKDIGDEDVDMGSMAAELSGDPIFKEKASLTKQINELSQLQRSFLQKKYDIEDNLRRLEKRIPYYEKQIIGLSNSLPLLDKIPRDKDNDPVLQVKVEGRFFDKPGDATRAMLNFAGARKDSSNQEHLMAEVWGFPVMIHRDYAWESGFSRQIKTPFDTNVGTSAGLAQGELALSLQIREAILGIPFELDKTKQKLHTAREELLIYKKQLSEDFPYTQQLTTQTVRLNEVDKLVAERVEADKKERQNRQKLIETEEDTYSSKRTVKIN